jgi:signal transduction histidine kinase
VPDPACTNPTPATAAGVHEAERRYLALFNSIDQGFCTIHVAFDEHDRAVDYRFVEVSPSFARQTGIVDAAGRWMRDIAGNQDEHWFEIYGRVSLTGEPARFEAGSTPLGRWWSVYAFRLGEQPRGDIAVLFNDITPRKQAEEALRRSQEQLKAELADTRLLQTLSIELALEREPTALYERLADAAATIMRSDCSSLQMLHTDREAPGELRLLSCRGFTDEAKQFWHWVRPDSRSTCGAAMRSRARVVVADVERDAMMAGSDDLATYRAAGIRAVQTTPLVSRDGALVGMISTHWKQPHEPGERDLRLLDILARQAADLIERVQAVEAIRRNEEALREADRRKDEFLATLAHELRNPLAPIRTGLELIRIAGDTPGAVARVREMMERQVAHMVRLIDDLLDVSRITSGKILLRRERAALHDLVSSAIEANRAAITEKRIELRVALPEAACALDVDPTRFVQVVSNLVHNAAKFTGRGGSIAVSATVSGTDPAGHDDLVLSVKDTGIGISPELMPLVFEPFVQGDHGSAQPGLGLGLALARRLVEMHGGRIEVRSDGPGHGSEFVVRVPVSGRQT